MPTYLAPPFLETDPSVLVDALVAAFETVSGRKLYPAQVERLLMDLMAYRESLVRHAIQGAAEQNLVDFATEARLEALGRLVGVSSRIAATSATCTWHLTLPEALGADSVTPIGFQAMSPNGTTWQTTTEGIIPAGQLAVNVEAQAVAPGAADNGFAVGANFSPLTGNLAITAVTVSEGGADTETDDQLRARILLAPFGFSVAGSSGAYRFHALGAHPSIVDVAVANIGPGQVGVYPLTVTGLPSADVKGLVLAALSDETVRPLCDAVTVADPTVVPFVLEVNLTTFDTADNAVVLANVQDMARSYVKDRAEGLGRDLIGSQIIKLLSLDGVYKIELVGWADRVLTPNEWADGTTIPTIHLIGSAHG